MSIISAAVGWWAGHISHATIQTQLVDPINALADDVSPICRTVIRAGSGPLTLGTPALVGSFDSTQTNVGDIAYSGGVMTVGTAATYAWDSSDVFPAGASNAHLVLVAVQVNGVSVQYGRQATALNTGHQVTVTAGGTLPPLSVGDTVQLVIESYDETTTVQPASFTLRKVA